MEETKLIQKKRKYEINLEVSSKETKVDETKINETKLDETKLKETKIDPIFDPINKRDSVFPIQEKIIWEMYKKESRMFWQVEEIDFSHDIVDWNTKLTENDRYFIKHVLAFFAQSDFIVNKHLSGDEKDEETSLINKITIMELKFFYDYQVMMENVHSEAYATMLEIYIKDEEELQNLKNAISTIDFIKKKAEWVHKWIKKGTMVERIIAMACTEGIFFSGSFCAIYWLNSRGLMPGLSHSNELISKDEGMHRDMGCIIYQKYVFNKLSKDEVKNIIKEAVDMEKEFVCKSLPVKLIGMNSDLMTQYIEFVADHLCYNLIDELIYNVENPFSWMNMISITHKTNFFEKRVSNYSKPIDNSNIKFDSAF